MTGLSALDILALTIFGESAGEQIEGKNAVGAVCRNRLKSGRWGSSYESVCLAPMQFSCWTPIGGAENYRRLKGISEEIMHGAMPDDDVLRECYWVATGIQSGAARDYTSHATHYHTLSMAKFPSWANGHVAIAKIGAHAFYSGIA